ncbi:MAG: hypothetical protein RID91_11915 [Azospirillaceae bacterium]
MAPVSPKTDVGPLRLTTTAAEQALARTDRPALDRVLAFYRQNSDDGIRPRPTEMVERTHDNGALFIVERVADGAILAAAGLFDFEDEATGEVLFEGGADLVTADANGLGLQRILGYARLLHWHLFQGSGIYGAIAPPNSASLHNLERIGLVPGDLPDHLMAARADAFGIAAGLSGKVFLHLPEGAMAKLVVAMLREFGVGAEHFTPPVAPVTIEARRKRATLQLEAPVFRISGLADLLAGMVTSECGQ